MYDITLIATFMKSAGERAMQYFRNVTPSWKANQTYVTEADVAVQAYLKEELERHFPDDGLIGEEHDLAKPPRAGDRYWIIDPIDGTASFVRGFPGWGIALGLFTSTQALGGFFYMPATGDFYATLPDGTVRRNDQIMPLHAPDLTSRETVLLTGARLHRAYTIAPEYQGKVRSLGSAIAHLCYVATGSADAAFMSRLAVWDLAAGLAMLKQNQGVLEYLDGTPVTVAELLRQRKSSQAMFAGHPDAVAYFRKLIAPRAATSSAQYDG